MDASSRTILGLISEMNACYVVPVYQRPYSWGEEQCVQLWDDVLAVGRRAQGSHFTGSIVTVQDGRRSRDGVARLLLIDGQQRMTTIELLLAALARYATRHPERSLAFTGKEILEGGFLTNRFRGGNDHYKLTLSKSDKATFAALIDALERGDLTHASDGRIAENLALFERRIEVLDDVDAVWRGLQRLEVVSIALDQKLDDAQVIFESMNSTGKDLTNADLVRNFVLMSYPLNEQQDLYRTYWQPIEHILGEDGFDETFDGFMRCFLGIAYAPTSMDKADVYQTFKRYVLFHGYNQNDRMKNLSLRLKRYARYYVAVVRAQTQDAELARAFARIGHLGVPAVNPLLVTLYDAYEHQQLSHADFVSLAGLLEAYLVRRLVCDCSRSVLAPFFTSLVARVDAVRAEGANVAEALPAMLANEEGGPRRMPSDAEFSHALSTRDLHDAALVTYVLAGIEEAQSPDAAAPLRVRRWTVEHIMPLRALASEDWRAALGADPERAFEASVNSLGNLALTSCEFDAQEASFAEKRERVSADGLLTSADVVAAEAWTPDSIARRAQNLVAQACAAWPLPQVPEGAGLAYRLSQRAAALKQVTFADLFDAGLVEMDDALVSVSPLHPGRATVTSTGKIMLANGEMFEDPTAAYERFLESLGTTSTGQSGWMFWRRGEGGPLLDDLRGELR
ncbi:MAG: DUF262 domain-containing protein [Atopobiaceae bacterium]|nr:DUF262 domain-containing protein [Atopobiaceae bacterium]MBR3314641.1 DUF262 domain-containing protein [Atopobiaceae bacterium]